MCVYNKSLHIIKKVCFVKAGTLRQVGVTANARAWTIASVGVGHAAAKDI